jgi:hypothetical protein
MTVTIKSIKEVQKQKKQQLKNVVKAHYKNVLESIRVAQDYKQQATYYTISPYLAMYPKYDVNYVARSIQHTLSKKNKKKMTIQILNNDTLYITWKPTVDINPVNTNKYRDEIEKIIQDAITRELDNIVYTVFPEDTNVCVSEVMVQLREHFDRAGFVVSSPSSNTIRISWNDQEVKREEHLKKQHQKVIKEKAIVQKDLDKITRINEDRFLYFINPKNVRKPKEETKSKVEEKYLKQLQEMKSSLRTIMERKPFEVIEC